MRKFPSKRLILLLSALFLVLLVTLGVERLARDVGKVELIIQSTSWDTNGYARVTYLLTNGTSGTRTLMSRSFVNDQTGAREFRELISVRGYTTEKVLYEKAWAYPPSAPLHPNWVRLTGEESITNIMNVEVKTNKLGMFRLLIPIYHVENDLLSKSATIINDRFPKLLPQRFQEKWIIPDRETIYSDWITPTGVFFKLGL